jgi:hypothetical protein
MIAAGPWGLMTPYGDRDGRLVREAFGEMEINFPPNDEEKKAIAEGKMFRRVAEPYRHLVPGEWIGEWFFRFTPKALKPGVKVLIADTEGNPLLLEAPLGKGQIFLSAVPLYPAHGLIREEIQKAVVSLARCDKEGVLYAVVREDARGHRYLGVVNSSSREALDSTVTVAGRYPQVTDLGVGDGFPVPSTVEGRFTRFPLHLAPGEGTILRLGPDG